MEKIRPSVNPIHTSPSEAELSALFNMSVPPRTTYEVVVKPVAGVFWVFKLPPPTTPLSKEKLADSIFQTGQKGIPSIEEVEAAASEIPAFLIGIHLQPYQQEQRQTVTDAARTIAILSRRVGEIYVRSRQPDYTAAHLYSQQPFAVEAWKTTYELKPNPLSHF